MKNNLANKILEIRKKNGLTQDEFAAKLFVTRQAISRWETGETTPSIDTIEKIIEIFNVDGNFFFNNIISKENGGTVNNDVSIINYKNGYDPSNPVDTGSVIYMLIGFIPAFGPILCLILYFTLKNTQPLNSKQAKKGAIIGGIIWGSLLIFEIIVLMFLFS